MMKKIYNSPDKKGGLIMSNKKNNASLKTVLRKALPALLVIALVLIGYYISTKKNGGGEELSIYQPGETDTLQINEQTDPSGAETDTEPPTEYQITWENNDEDEDAEIETSPDIVVSTETSYDYYLTFYSDKLLNQHYEKHGRDMGFDSPEAYEEAANRVVFNEDTLHKTEKEDGDDVYYLEETNEFVVVSVSGYIRTYFLPDDGLAYFNRQ